MNECQFSDQQGVAILDVLKARFLKNMHRHQQVAWEKVEERIHSNASKLSALIYMENTGGEPDVIGYNEETGEYIFCDCSKESPAGRRSLCYDHEALNSRKENKPKNSAVNMASEMGVELLSEKQYLELQAIERVDAKTSSWLLTPQGIRDSGGAIFGDWRYGRVFFYHNGAESYYSSRGFRGLLRV